MLPFKKILFPVDYSPASDALIPCVRAMAAHSGAEVILVHAYPSFLIYSDALALTNAEWPEEMRGIEEKRLKDFARSAFPDHAVQTFVGPGEPADVIHDVIARHGADLIMMGTHGRGAVRRLLLGSVASKILHDATTPVWMGTEAALETFAANEGYKSVLCAVDETDSAVNVMKAAAAFATSWKAQLSIVHALEVPLGNTEIDTVGFRASLTESSDHRLSALKHQLGMIGVPHAVADAGTVAEGVRQDAARRDADIIIVGRGHAHDRVLRLWSDLYSIVRQAPCPVLSFPA